jgi:hypothetical protein
MCNKTLVDKTTTKARHPWPLLENCDVQQNLKIKGQGTAKRAQETTMYTKYLLDLSQHGTEDYFQITTWNQITIIIIIIVLTTYA